MLPHDLSKVKMTARRFKDLVEDIAADLGGKDSEGQRQLIRRAVMLSAESRGAT
jgi:hypothetical protein